MVADRVRQGGSSELERLLGEQARLLPLYEPKLADVTGPLIRIRPDEITAEQAQQRLFASVRQTLEVLTRDRPAILAIDDLQWADELTLGFVNYLVERGDLTGLPVLLIGTCRSEDTPPAMSALEHEPSVMVHTIGRLDEHAVRSMVGDMLALEEPPGPLLDFLVQHSEGNPFFVGEYLQAALAEGIIARDRAGRWQVSVLDDPLGKAFASLALPPGMRELIRRRLDGLSHGAHRVIMAAAVIGRRVDTRILAAVSGMKHEAFVTALREATNGQFLEELDSEHVYFSHSKIREVAYGRLPAQTRAAVHRAVAQVVERRAPDSGVPDELQAALGYHWEASGDADRASSCYLAAARSNAERFAEREAERLYRATLRLMSEASPATAQVQLELVERVLLPMKRHAEAASEARAALTHMEGRDEATAVFRAKRLLALAEHELA